MEKDKAVMEITQLASYVRWGQSTEKGQKLEIRLINGMYNFLLVNRTASGKFDGEKLSVTFGNFQEMAFANICKEMVFRLKEIIEKGKTLEKKALSIDNSRTNPKEWTQKVTLDVYTDSREDNRSSFVAFIRLSKKEKPEDEKASTMTLYFDTGRSIQRYNDNKVAHDYKVYNFLEELLMIFESCASRTNLSRDKHLSRYYQKMYGDSNNNSNENNNNKSYNKSYDDDGDDMPF